MCKSGDLTPDAVRASSAYSSTSVDYSSESSDYSTTSEGSPLARHPMEKPEFVAASTTEKWNFTALLKSILGGILVGIAMTGFALKFPFVLAPQAAEKTYHWAYYNYDPSISHFDNTIWTYGTDYGLAVIMTVLALTILSYARSGVSDTLSRRAAYLLLGYAISTAAGGYGHQFFLTLESRNCLTFRLLWTVCVGTVSGASCFMGISASEAVRKYQQQPNCDPRLKRMPVAPESFWWAFGGTVTAVCAYGGMSFHRPACDIFIAGTTQVPSTFYLMAFFVLLQHSKVALSSRIMGLVGFILNAPLLPMYPLLVQYTDWSLGSVNTLLHSVLCVAWSMQGFSMLRLIQGLNKSADEIAASKKV